ncbi:hypothetical protein [Pontibacter ruber]|uniref:STAS/SEC14 domain-containing protein n=1 Tax=Pontibacter ruber TaxID=1343895 RepID=A0ABW5CZF9_9BACT|nr:hypothetical protein [Pontibacter ruber]
MEREFENEFGKTFSKVSYLHDFCTVVVEWHGYTTNQQIEQVTNWIEEQARFMPCTSIMNDCSKIISVWADSLQWFSRNWMPKMQGIGVTNFIHVAKPNTFGDKIGKSLRSILDSQVRFHTFGNKKEAMEWLENYNTTSC